MERKTQFRIALALHSDRTGKEYTVKDFAEDHSCTSRMVFGVLKGSHTSARLEEAIQQFIAEEAEAAGIDMDRSPVPA